MSDGYVFDTEAIIAFLYREPGHETVAEFLNPVFAGTTPGFVTETNATEVFYLIARFEGIDDQPTRESFRLANRDIRTLDSRGLQIERADWRFAGRIKAQCAIPLADAFAVSLAHNRDATLIIGADDDFSELPVNVKIRRFRVE